MLVAFGGQAMLLAALAFLIKRFINHSLEKDLERYKGDLRAAADTSLEHTKALLQRAAAEHQIRFTSLHERRAQVLADLYERLAELFYAVQELATSPVPPSASIPEGRYATAMAKLVDANHFYQTRRIFLPERACLHVESFIQSLGFSAAEIGVYQFLRHDNSDNRRAQLEAMHRTWLAIQTEYTQAKSALEAEFQSVLHGGALTQ